MITVITGVPGSGKTLYMLTWLKGKAERENRQVYYSGIAELKLPWIEHDPTKWEELPAGSIIVIDECQRVFRPRANGSAVPSYIAAMETHRHKGVDIVLLTQHPMMVDQNIRRLCGQHFHVVRVWGTHAATVHEWASIKENADKSRADSTKHAFKYPKDVFALYKSAELHTHKARIPGRVYVLASVPVLLAFIGYRLYSSIMARTEDPAVVQAAAPSSAKPATPALHDEARSRTGMTPLQYAEQFQPRIAGLAYTAPAYDQVTKPTRAPYPAACVELKTRCQCYTQQGTKLQTEPDLCKSIVAGGFFMAWDERARAEVPRPLPAPAPAEKLAGGDVDGLINLTPGYTPRTREVTVAQAQEDGAGVRAARRPPAPQ